MKRQSFIALLLIDFVIMDMGNSLTLRGQQRSSNWNSVPMQRQRETPLEKAFAHSDSNITFVSAISYGEAQSVFAKGGYAYIGTSVAFMIIDIKDLTNPELVGHLHILGGVRRLALQDSLVYGVGGEELHVIDVSKPGHPVEVGSFSLGTGRRAMDISLSDHYTYIADGEGLWILDVSDPKNPTLVGSYTGIVASGVRVSGQYAYIVTYAPALYVLDVSDPTAPKDVAKLAITGLGSPKLSLSGSYVYLSLYEGNLKSRIDIIDISDLGNLRVVGSYKISGTPPSLYAVWPLLYLGIARSGFHILDVSDPADPKEIGHYDGVSGALYIAGAYAYVAAGLRGLHILDVANPPQPQEVGNYALEVASYQSVEVSGNYAYLACADSGLQIWDVSNPEAPHMVGSWKGQRPEGGYDTGFILNSIALYGQYAYVTDWRGGVYILDISDPSILNKAGYYTLEHGVDNPIISGHYLYVTTVFKGLCILDVSNPTAPQKAGSYELEGVSPKQVRGLAASGGYAYLLAKTDNQERLLILDVSDPSHPTKVGEYLSNAILNSIDVGENYAYMTMSESLFRSSFLVIDISEKQAPRLVTNFPLEFGSISPVMQVTGRLAYLCYERFPYAEILVIDLSEPVHPTKAAEAKIDRRLGELYTSNFLFASQDNHIYVALGINGFNILKFTPSTGVSVTSPETLIPDRFSLGQNYPNPFNSETIINYQLPQTAKVTLKIYNLLGQVGRTLVDALQKPGFYTARWDSRDDRGRELPSGVYLYRLEVGGTNDERSFVETRKMLLIR